MNPWRYKGRYHIHKMRIGCYNYEHSENMKKAPRNEKYDDKKKKSIDGREVLRLFDFKRS